ncbi:MAG: hypothetical protein ACTSU5_08160 [Promethearchaeota archaeon]
MTETGDTIVRFAGAGSGHRIRYSYYQNFTDETQASHHEWGNMTYWTSPGDSPGILDVDYGLNLTYWTLGCTTSGYARTCEWNSTAKVDTLALQTLEPGSCVTYYPNQMYWGYNHTTVASEPASVQRRHEWSAVVESKAYGQETFEKLPGKVNLTVGGTLYQCLAYNSTLSTEQSS